MEGFAVNLLAINFIWEKFWMRTRPGPVTMDHMRNSCSLLEKLINDEWNRIRTTVT